ncbi:bifunctional diguanylate cyclase/phosphodiesterase [Pseudidiomarina sp. 1APR75-15]|uniref:Bifunctional diguanylate cyclase/phosphodiesterase n=1 Tax=Pseudidiomarina terrestris TaxID=2820060 RepID=A0ABT8MEB2_9GAMM|nr:bifunctional diguanylate cyclase/phosphodiesterase [Pseudidiomarina sp. 1APR75-15]MDN7128276.1 bifunctional diguanylate cyclase/phosphodiesterase [Pseudidiomarina sp. 1APR75-15]
MSPRRVAAFIAICYLVLGLVWIRFSDQILLAFAADSNLLTELQTFKGWAYVILTAGILYWLSKSALERERNLSERDSLTRLLNRHMFGRELASEIEFADDNDQSLVLVVLNIDGFKQLNSTAGSDVGDRFLQSVASLLRDHFKQRVLLSRFGADEFAIAMPVTAWPDQVLPQVQHLQQLIQTISIPELPGSALSACFGLARFPTDAKTSEALIDCALTALEEAKSMGSNRLRVYKTEYGEHASKRTKLLFDLKAAIANKKLSVVYQPQFRLDDHSISGVEVLARWHHPEKGLIPPDIFIPLAEKHGLICEITDFIMQTAISELLQAELLYRPIPRVSFNVSAADFNTNQSSQRFLHNLAKLPEDDWSVVELELTETSALLNLEGVKNVLQVLRERGVQVSLDDFGTGYSSLSTLRLLPIQELKIDQSFVRDIASNAHDARLVKTILAMAKALQLRVVAEGVESQQQARYLAKEGCQEVQGYLYAKPMSLQALQSFASNIKASAAQR